jgi:hypothetical protein
MSDTNKKPEPKPGPPPEPARPPIRPTPPRPEADVTHIKESGDDPPRGNRITEVNRKG